MSLHRFPLPTNHTQRNIHCIYYEDVTVYKKAIAFRQSNYLTHMRYTEYVLFMTSVILPKYKILHEECDCYYFFCQNRLENFIIF